jgi:DNA-binding GntR family transcriptional regulator
VREALRLLERDGLVAKTTQGYEVADISAQEAGDLFEILADLEELYTRKATPHLLTSQLAALQTALTEMQAAVNADDVVLYYRLNIRFHQIIRDACPNRPLIGLLGSLGKKTLRLRRLAMSIPGRMPVSLVEHVRIHAALQSGDATAAGLLARASAIEAYAALEKLFRSDLVR